MAPGPEYLGYVPSEAAAIVATVHWLAHERPVPPRPCLPPSRAALLQVAFAILLVVLGVQTCIYRSLAMLLAVLAAAMEMGRCVFLPPQAFSRGAGPQSLALLLLGADWQRAGTSRAPASATPATTRQWWPRWR